MFAVSGRLPAAWSAEGLLNTGHGLCLWYSYWSGHKRLLTVLVTGPKLPLSISYTNSLSSTYTHQVRMLFMHNCVSGLIHLQERKKMHRLEQTGIQKTEKRKEKKGTLFWPRQWVCDCVSVLLFIVSLGYETKLFSRGLMAGEQRTIG